MREHEDLSHRATGKTSFKFFQRAHDQQRASPCRLQQRCHAAGSDNSHDLHLHRPTEGLNQVNKSTVATHSLLATNTEARSDNQEHSLRVCAAGRTVVNEYIRVYL